MLNYPPLAIMEDFIFERFNDRGVKIVVSYHGPFKSPEEKKTFSNAIKLGISEAIRKVLVEVQNVKE